MDVHPKKPVHCHPLSSLTNNDPSNAILEHVQRLTAQQRLFGISLDLDVFSPEVAPAVTTPAPDGIDLQNTLKTLKKASESPYFIGIEIAEFTPSKDINHRTESLILTVIDTLFGAQPT